jgi:hypothetical protein
MAASGPGPTTLGAASTIARLLAVPTTQAETTSAKPDSKQTLLLSESSRALQPVTPAFEPVFALTDACGIAPETVFTDLAISGVLQLRGRSFEWSILLLRWRIAMQELRAAPCSTSPTPRSATTSLALVGSRARVSRRQGVSHNPAVCRPRRLGDLILASPNLYCAVKVRRC